MKKYETRDDVPPCDYCQGHGEIYCGALPPIVCPECLGAAKDPDALREWKRGVEVVEGSPQPAPETC